MDAQQPTCPVSAFLTSHLSDFFDHFGINFCIDGPQLEYFVYEKQTGLDISCSLTVNFDDAAGEINVMTFYPGLCLHPGTRYLSAVCFYLVMQHFANFHHIHSDCRICLHTRKAVFDTFYAALKDFDFHVTLCNREDRVDIESCFLSSDFDTTMILERPLVDDCVH